MSFFDLTDSSRAFTISEERISLGEVKVKRDRERTSIVGRGEDSEVLLGGSGEERT